MSDLDTKVMKLVTKAAEDFLKRNKGVLDSTRDMRAMKARIAKLEQELKELRREVENNKIRAEAAIKDTKKEAEVQRQIFLKSWREDLSKMAK